MDVLSPLVGVLIIFSFIPIVLFIVFLVSVFRYFRDVPRYIKSIALSLRDIADRPINDDDDIDDDF